MELKISYLGGNCPVQGKGTIDEEPFYFRARWGQWSMSIGGEDVVGNPRWYRVRDYGTDFASAGWMEESEARDFIEQCAKDFSEGKEP